MRAASKICSSMEPSAPTNIKAIKGAQPQVSLIASMKSAQNLSASQTIDSLKGAMSSEWQDIDKLYHDIDRFYDRDINQQIVNPVFLVEHVAPTIAL